MKKYLSIIILAITLGLSSCTEKPAAPQEVVPNLNEPAYELYPTKNMWNFLKLNTRDGRIWQVQYSINDDSTRFETPLNTDMLANSKKYNGRFKLYNTDNIYNFVMLDRETGKTYQVQWSFEPEKRMVLPISSDK